MFLYTISFVFGFLAVAVAGPIQWPSSIGGNDHWYEVVGVNDGSLPGEAGTGITWSLAAAEAGSMGGYLATLISEAEESFVYTQLGIGTNYDYWFLDGAGNWQGPWLGGYQLTGASAPGSDWQWVTGEAWGSDPNWAPGEPNDAGPELAPFEENDHEQYLQFFWQPSGPEPSWNDVVWNSPVQAYVVEYDVIPEPTTILFLGFGLIGLAGVRRKHKK